MSNKQKLVLVLTASVLAFHVSPSLADTTDNNDNDIVTINNKPEQT